MKSIFFALGLLLTTASCQTHQLTVTAHYPADTLEAPLYLRGNGCGLNWDSGLRMSEVSHTDQAVTLQCQATETVIEMKVLVGDDTWMQGANQRVDTTVAGGKVDMYPWFYKVEGTYKVFEKVHSPQLNNNRNVIVYLPPSYTENTLKVHSNVIVMHDG